MPGRSWEAWEVQELKSHLAKGLAASEMTIGSRTAAAIQRKAARMHLVGDGISRRPWSREDERLLQTLVERGTAVKRMAKGELSGFTKNAIQKKIGRMQLADRQRSERIKQAVRLGEEELQQFRVFLYVRSERCTPEQIALLWNREHEIKVSRRRVIYHLQSIGSKRPWRDVMQMAYSKAKQRRRSEKVVASQNRRWATYREELVENLKNSALALRRKRRHNGAAVKECVCRQCHKRWPQAEPFFTKLEKQNGTGRHVYHARVCKLCKNEHRREKALQQRSSGNGDNSPSNRRDPNGRPFKCAS